MIDDGPFRVWRSSDIAWGLTMCEAPGCFRSAAVLADYDQALDVGVPVCLDDADVLLERFAAQEWGRVDQLADPWELARRQRGRRPRGPQEYELADPARPELGTIGERTPERFLAEQGWFGEQKRRQVLEDPDWDFPEEWG